MVNNHLFIYMLSKQWQSCYMHALLIIVYQMIDTHKNIWLIDTHLYGSYAFISTKCYILYASRVGGILIYYNRGYLYLSGYIKKYVYMVYNQEIAGVYMW